MALWAANSAIANNAPKSGVLDKVEPRGNTAYGNVTVGSFRTNQAVGVFGVDTAEMANVASNPVSHAGWVKVVQGAGPVTSITITAGGTGYGNTNLINVSGGVVNATATLTTNSTGGITAVVLTVPGEGFKSIAASTVAVTNATGGATGVGTGATLAAVLGGRAGRVHMETLVAMGSISSDGSDDSIFPDA